MEHFRHLKALLLFSLLVVEERNCSDPGGPVNGYKKITGGPGLVGGRYAKIGTIVSFFCNNSYVLSGNEKRTCQQNGEWSGKQPICIKGNLQRFLTSVEIVGVAGLFGTFHIHVSEPLENAFLSYSVLNWNYILILGWQPSLKTFASVLDRQRTCLS